MFKMYNTDLKTNVTTEITEFKKGNWINMIAPTDEEIKLVCEKLKIQEDFIRYSLDSEEKARIDIEEDDGTTLFIIDVPIMDEENKEEIHSTMPLGMIVVRDDYFLTVSLKPTKLISEFEQTKLKKGIVTYKKSRMILQIFYKNAQMYLTELRKIDKEKIETEKELNVSMKNKELLKMMNLEKGLVYGKNIKRKDY